MNLSLQAVATVRLKQGFAFLQQKRRIVGMEPVNWFVNSTDEIGVRVDSRGDPGKEPNRRDGTTWIISASHLYQNHSKESSSSGTNGLMFTGERSQQANPSCVNRIQHHPSFHGVPFRAINIDPPAIEYTTKKITTGI